MFNSEYLQIDFDITVNNFLITMVQVPLLHVMKSVLKEIQKILPPKVTIINDTSY